MTTLSGKRIVIAGGSGFLGLLMAEHFAGAGADVTVLSRSKPKADGRWSHHFWDGRALGDWTAVLDEMMSGAYIVSSPNPKSQANFMRTLRNIMGMPIGLPAFEWMVRIGAPLLMRTDPELVLYGRYVIPKRLLDEGFKFRFPELKPALIDLRERKN